MTAVTNYSLPDDLSQYAPPKRASLWAEIVHIFKAIFGYELWDKEQAYVNFYEKKGFTDPIQFLKANEDKIGKPSELLKRNLTIEKVMQDLQPWLSQLSQ